VCTNIRAPVNAPIADSMCANRTQARPQINGSVVV
jgi:hypothetical protein